MFQGRKCLTPLTFEIMATYQFVKLNSAAQREQVAIVDGMTQAEATAAMQKKSDGSNEDYTAFL